LDNDEVTLTYFGDGAANQGQVYESFNMAALWKLPVLYIIENNHYAMGTSTTRSTAQTKLHKRGDAFGIPGGQCDGMDVLAVRDAVTKAVKHMRTGKGPYILEAMTYRYRGHSMSDPAKYRTRNEVNKVRQERDPIDHVRDLILESGASTELALKATDKEVKAIVTDAADFAQQSPEPDLSELYTNIVIAADAAE
jgi:pyruvate dehydrogenase E1 component alpha subunit